ncbi:MAG: hypothetical protein ACNS62_24305 [Candidatus Cyclobacteriaceae bacterium M3_2C_046]
MKALPQDWLTQDLIDFEYKKFIVLAYLKDVKENFNQYFLYPFLSDLVFHYRNLISIRENKKLIYENFPKAISKADFEKLKLNYEKIVDDDDLMKELEEIIEFSLTKFQLVLDEGKSIYEYVEENVQITPIGLSPLYAKEGYLLINQKDQKEMEIHRYLITVFESADETYQGVHTEYLETVYKQVSSTYESLKLELIKKYRQMPNPATYLIYSKINLPFQETLFPVAKRLLVKYVNSTSS